MQRAPLFVTHRVNTVARDRRISARRLVLMLIPGICAVALAAARAPLPQGLDGITMCLPLIGPVTRIDSTLTGRARMLAEVHEGAHAARCREVGALRSYVAGLTIDGKLRAEALAFCAEAHWDLAVGYPRENILARIADELETAYGWTAGRSRGEIVATIGAACPPLSTRARAGD